MKKKQGSPFPLGATLYNDGCNFAIHSPDKIISLIIFTNDNDSYEYSLNTDDQIIYYLFIPNIKAATKYGYKITDDNGNSRLLLDPYAHQLSKPLEYNYPLDAEQSWTLSKSVVVDHAFDWEEDTPPIILSKKQYYLNYTPKDLLNNTLLLLPLIKETI